MPSLNLLKKLQKRSLKQVINEKFEEKQSFSTCIFDRQTQQLTTFLINLFWNFFTGINSAFYNIPTEFCCCPSYLFLGIRHSKQFKKMPFIDMSQLCIWHPFPPQHSPFPQKRLESLYLNVHMDIFTYFSSHLHQTMFCSKTFHPVIFQGAVYSRMVQFSSSAL